MGEIFLILRSFYQIDTKIILEHVRDLLNSNITFYQFTPDNTLPILEETTRSNLEINDIKLFQLALKVQAPIIVTDDRNLAKYVKTHKMLHETPISDETRMQIDKWEQKKLPPKGLPRILFRIYNYFLTNNVDLAQRFREDTRGFRKMPEI
ncbi:MAG: hypothetical protein RBG13Loki_0012 [Promethearchaeota archaeon CR_4]|nr:MAG: hypothetical protein RBG13Loki_0012 [Candidatus Lokiarchaeota archaeon CR_4]